MAVTALPPFTNFLSLLETYGNIYNVKVENRE